MAQLHRPRGMGWTVLHACGQGIHDLRVAFRIQFLHTGRQSAYARQRFPRTLQLAVAAVSIGQLNAAFFTGEVLVLYALAGFVLVATCRLSTRTLLVIAGMLIGRQGWFRRENLHNWGRVLAMAICCFVPIRHHTRGPPEYLWCCATWLEFSLVKRQRSLH